MSIETEQIANIIKGDTVAIGGLHYGIMAVTEKALLVGDIDKAIWLAKSHITHCKKIGIGTNKRALFDITIPDWLASKMQRELP
jgi:hypothetical protein